MNTLEIFKNLKTKQEQDSNLNLSQSADSTDMSTVSEEEADPVIVLEEDKKESQQKIEEEPIENVEIVRINF